MVKSRVFLALTAFGLFTGTGHSELFLTAEVAPTIGLTGFDTYRITATSDLGNIVCFDFSQESSYGISGPMNQVNPYGQATLFPNLNPLFGASDPSQDTQFLLDNNDVLSMFMAESDTFLHGVFALIGDKQRTIGNSVPFLQLATSASSAVNLTGSVVIRRPNDELLSVPIDIGLWNIPVQAAPLVDVLPVPEPIIPPPVNPIAPVPVPTPEPIDPDLAGPAPGEEIIELPRNDPDPVPDPILVTEPPQSEPIDSEPTDWWAGEVIARPFVWRLTSDVQKAIDISELKIDVNFAMPVWDGDGEPIYITNNSGFDSIRYIAGSEVHTDDAALLPTDGDGYSVHPDVTSFDFLSRFQGTSGSEFVSADSDQRLMLLRELQHLAYAQKHYDARTYLAAGMATGVLAAANAVSAPEPSSAFLACAIAACVTLVSRSRTAAR